MANLQLTPSQLSIFNFLAVVGMEPKVSIDVQTVLSDLKPCLGSAVVVGGIAVIRQGYQRFTDDVDILYAHTDGTILKRLSVNFKIIKRAKNGWHHLQHKKSKTRLELIPEGGLTTYGFIPGPHFFGSEDGFLPLWGLLWMKLVSGRAKDDADIVELARRRMSDVYAVRVKLPEELIARFDALLERAKREIASDPNSGATE